ncbi:hypothetical protein B0T17DRAFT_500002 [Bombardia bombarda]|uniref:HAUS augmin-like complex subunit 1 n=1 Tax=Bombardia bombarda TaxID=252184 RepID=A0AA39WCL6_9PEZI|nr:hypothetical protein B0T17DRAFT_500002 [Bombardia bombarda]
MAHLPPNTAIFSPSVARAAASAAKEWSFVDAWLARHYHGRSPPPFERNSDTLRALLALANANESADEKRQQVARLEAQALHALQQQHLQQQQQHQDDSQTPTAQETLSSAREAILTAIESSLSRDGLAALNAMASISLTQGLTYSTAPVADLGSRIITLSAQAAELEQTSARVQVLTRYVEYEAQQAAALVAELRDDPHYRPAADLAKQNLETQRKVKAMAARLPELRDRVSSLAVASSVGAGTPPSPTIEQVRREEEAYLALLAQKKELDARVRSFQGLPPDTDQARQQLESLRAELRHMTARRDAVFEGLVERETPRKSKRLP